MSSQQNNTTGLGNVFNSANASVEGGIFNSANVSVEGGIFNSANASVEGGIFNSANASEEGGIFNSANKSEEIQDVTKTLLSSMGISIVCSSTAAVPACCALYTLFKCRRIPMQVKRLSYNVIVSDLAFHVLMVIQAAAVLILGQQFNELIYYPRSIIFSLFVLVALASVAGITLERLLALTRTMTYSSILTKRNIKLITLYIWLAHTIVPFMVFVASVHLMCNSDYSLKGCDTWYVLLPFRAVLAAIYVVYHSFIVCAYRKISGIIQRHVEAISQQTRVHSIEKGSTGEGQNDNTTTSSIKRIVLSSEIVNFPILINAVLVAFIPSLQTTAITTLFQFVSYICNCVNTHINMYLYVWKMKECKFVFLNTFCSRIGRCRAMALRLKQEVYPFVHVVQDNT